MRWVTATLVTGSVMMLLGIGVTAWPFGPRAWKRGNGDEPLSPTGERGRVTRGCDPVLRQRGGRSSQVAR